MDKINCPYIRNFLFLIDIMVLEKMSYKTIAANGVGFDGRDGEFLTAMAKFYRDRKFLSPKQIHCIRYSKNGKPRMGKYAKQLMKMANG